MPQQTNRIPHGFLDLVGAEVGGKTPPVYADLVGPYVDMTELYLAETLAAEGVTFNHGAALATTFVTVPDDEAWLLRALGVNGTLSNTGQLERWRFDLIRLPREDSSNLGATIWVTDELTVPVNNQGISQALWVPAPVLLLPGVRINATIIQRDTAAARNTQLEFTFDRMRLGSRL